MFEEISNRKANLGYVWIKAVDSGNTYLCPASDVDEISSATDAALRAIGIDESKNPQNN
jgi:hypothetical protein